MHARPAKSRLAGPLTLVLVAVAAAACAAESPPTETSAVPAERPAPAAAAPSETVAAPAAQSASAPAERVVYTVEAEGAGWSAGERARGALSALPGVVDLKMSGTVGSFTLAAGAALDEPTVKAAVEKAELTFVRMTSERRPVAQAVWLFAGEGPTWATTLAKVRSDLLKSPGVCAVSFGEGVEVEVSDRTAFDEAKFREALREGGFTITEAKESRQDG